MLLCPAVIAGHEFFYASSTVNKKDNRLFYNNLFFTIPNLFLRILVILVNRNGENDENRDENVQRNIIGHFVYVQQVIFV